MAKKMAHRDCNELLPGFVTSQTQINPAPREHTAKGTRHSALLWRREEKTGGARKILLNIWIAILSSSDSNGFTSFKINILKQRFLIMSLASPCSAHGLHLSLSHSDLQLSSNNELFQLYSYFHIAMRSVIHGRACGCCTVLKLF